MNNKISCIAFALLLCITSIAQDKQAFRIIAFDGNVTLDGVPVTINQQVTLASKRLVIPDGAYAGVLLPWGIITRLGPGTNDVEALGSRKLWLSSQRAVMDGGPAIKPAGSSVPLLGDSIYLWWVEPTSKPLKLRVMNVFGDIYLDTLVQRQIVLKNFRRFFKKEKKIVVEIKQDKRSNEAKMITAIDEEPRKKLEHDLSQIQNHPDKEILTIAILETHQLYLDAAVRVRGLKSVRTDLPVDLNEYIKTLRRELGWDN